MAQVHVDMITYHLRQINRKWTKDGNDWEGLRRIRANNELEKFRLNITEMRHPRPLLPVTKVYRYPTGNAIKQTLHWRSHSFSVSGQLRPGVG